MSIDTTVDGNPASMRASGEWLRSLPEDIHDVASALLFARGIAEAAWIGKGGDALNRHTIGLVHAGDGLKGDVDKLGIAFTEFADGLTRAKEIMDDAREAAAGADLLSGTTIVAVDPPDDRAGPMDTPEHMAARQRTFDAFTDAAGQVEHARMVEKTAHDNFAGGVQSVMGSVDQNLSGPIWLGTGAAVTYVNTASAQYLDWTEISNARAEQSARFIEIAGEPNAAVARSAAASVEAFGPAARQAEAIAQQNGRMIGPLSAMPHKGALRRDAW